MPKKQSVNLIQIQNCPFFRKQPSTNLAASNRYLEVFSRSHSGKKLFGRRSSEKFELRRKDQNSSGDQERPGNDQMESRSENLLLDIRSGASNTLERDAAPDTNPQPTGCPIHATPVNSLAQSGQLPNQQGQQPLPFKTLQNSPTLINNLMSSSDNDSILNVIKNELNGCNVSPFTLDEEKEKSRTQKLPVLKITKIGALANQIKSNQQKATRNAELRLFGSKHKISNHNRRHMLKNLPPDSTLQKQVSPAKPQRAEETPGPKSASPAHKGMFFTADVPQKPIINEEAEQLVQTQAAREDPKAGGSKGEESALLKEIFNKMPPKFKQFYSKDGSSSKDATTTNLMPKIFTSNRKEQVKAESPSKTALSPNIWQMKNPSVRSKARASNNSRSSANLDLVDFIGQNEFAREAKVVHRRKPTQVVHSHVAQNPMTSKPQQRSEALLFTQQTSIPT